MARRRGIDVSKWQGRIDWDRVSQDDIRFAMIRIGYGSSDGTATRDSFFERNIRRALDANIPVGVYFYTYARSRQAVKREAEWVIRELRRYLGRISYPIVIDIEDSSLEDLGKRVNTDHVKEFCDALKDAGYYAMYYTYLSFLEEFLEYDRLREYDLWLADYSSDSPHRYDYGIWQYSDDGRLHGIRGHVDMNESRKNYSAIIKEAGLNGFDNVEELQATSLPNSTLKNKSIRIDGFLNNHGKGLSLAPKIY